MHHNKASIYFIKNGYKNIDKRKYNKEKNEKER